MPELTNRERYDVYKGVTLGVPAREGESEEARRWRADMEREVKEIVDGGMMPDSPPFDFHDDE